MAAVGTVAFHLSFLQHWITMVKCQWGTLEQFAFYEDVKRLHANDTNNSFQFNSSATTVLCFAPETSHYLIIQAISLILLQYTDIRADD